MNRGQFKQHAENTLKELQSLFEPNTNIVLEVHKEASVARIYVGDEKKDIHRALVKPMDPVRPYVLVGADPKGFNWNIMFQNDLRQSGGDGPWITVAGPNLTATSAEHIYKYLTTGDYLGKPVEVPEVPAETIVVDELVDD